MGATASMSIALSVHGRLWGLISAHHYSGPLLVPHEVRATCELIGIVCSMQLQTLEQLEAAEARAARRAARSKVLDRVAASESILDGLADEALLAVCNARGRGDPHRRRAAADRPDARAAAVDAARRAREITAHRRAADGELPGVLVRAARARARQLHRLVPAGVRAHGQVGARAEEPRRPIATG